MTNEKLEKSTKDTNVSRSEGSFPFPRRALSWTVATQLSNIKYHKLQMVFFRERMN